jgi:hypothetical protein
MDEREISDDQSVAFSGKEKPGGQLVNGMRTPHPIGNA